MVDPITVLKFSSDTYKSCFFTCAGKIWQKISNMLTNHQNLNLLHEIDADKEDGNISFQMGSRNATISCLWKMVRHFMYLSQ